jgi:hypothetical protein
MLKNKFVIVVLVILGNSLHLRGDDFHFALQSSQLSITLQSALSQLKKLNQSIDSSVSALNPYNQLERVSSLETTIVSARKQLI